MSSRVVARCCHASIFIDSSNKCRSRIAWNLVGNMYTDIVFLLSVDDFDYFIATSQRTLVAYLTTHFSIERSLAEENLVELFILLFHLTITQDLSLRSCVVITDKFFFTFANNYPVACLYSRCIASARLLLFHFGIESFDIHGHTIFAKDQFCKVKRETVCVIKHKCIYTADYVLRSFFCLNHKTVKHTDTLVECTQEWFFLFLDNLSNQVLRSHQFRVWVTHLSNQSWHQLIEECFLAIEECVSITHCTTQDTTDNVAGLSIWRQLIVGNRERDSTDVVGNYTHCDINLFILTILHAWDLCDDLNHWLEHISVVVWLFALQSHTKTFKAHTGINYLCRQWFEAAVSLTIVLHEHEVPDFNHLRVVLIDKRSTIYCSTLFVRTKVDMNFRTWTARTCVTHFPEVILLITVDNMRSGEVFFPIACSFIIATKTFLFRAFKHRCIKTIWIKFENIYKIFPRPVDSFFLEIIAKRPVTKHFKHCVVIGVVSYFLQVIVLTTDAKTLLRVGYASILGNAITQNNILKLIHTGIGKHQSRVVLNHHWRRRHNLVTFILKKLLERFTDFVWCQHSFNSLYFRLQSYKINGTTPNLEPYSLN